MNQRAFFLRGYAARPPFVNSLPSPADDCSKCRGGKYPCVTPEACGLREAPPIKLPLFWSDPLASKAIGWALAIGFVVAIWAGLT